MRPSRSDRLGLGSRLWRPANLFGGLQHVTTVSFHSRKSLFPLVALRNLRCGCARARMSSNGNLWCPNAHASRYSFETPYLKGDRTPWINTNNGLVSVATAWQASARRRCPWRACILA